ncbi:MAG: hypothetical protein ABL974_11055 [Prosthecobacter sp.]
MFDPNYPPLNAEIESAPLRGQFNGLKDFIDAIVTLTAAQIDGVTTLLPGEAASVGLTVTGNTLHFTFGIPRGDAGTQGQNGADGGAGPQGEPGSQGEPGAQGPPFANAVVDAVTTLNPGDPATVTVSFDGVNVHFTFGLPAGQNGSNGSDGAQGPPGEVTNVALAGAISSTSSNSNAVTTLGIVVSDPPTQPEMQSLANKVDELLLALRR